MSPSLQIALLSHLNVNPWSEEDDWPLLVHPRSLAVLAQVLLSKHRKDSKEEARQTSEAACLSIWKRLLETMIKYIEDPHVVGDRDRESEDLNVEHAQLLLFLFHSLQLMQKKAILLLCAQTLIRAAQAAFSIIPLHDTQLMLLARILLLLEYLIKNLYDAPVAMLEQIQWNLLSSAGLSSNGRADDAQQPSRMYNCCQELEDSYRKYGSEDEGCCIRPRFYLLSNVDSNNQDLPKLGKLFTQTRLIKCV
jgi:E3 ubiquitin-protein ligase UBR4